MRKNNNENLYRFAQCVVPEKIHTQPMEARSQEIPREAMSENKLEFPGGRGGGGVGCKTKNLPWVEYGYFVELHNTKCGLLNV